MLKSSAWFVWTVTYSFIGLSFLMLVCCSVKLPPTCYVYGVVWRLEARTFQTNTNFIKCNTLEFSTMEYKFILFFVGG